ncbi:histidine kinase [Neisseria sp. CCUG12390]|uniref:histidine kinase n=1 Tax=Neisseria sp. CCUG12390 TaxID=3392035 RepID=UPI003A0FCC89
MNRLTQFSDGPSLSARLKFLTVLWVSSALFSVVFTLILSWRLEGAGTAINHAGSLRMQTYRLTHMVHEKESAVQVRREIQAFEQTLLEVGRSGVIKPLLPSRSANAVNSSMIQSSLLADWQQKIRPALEAQRLPDNQDLYRFAGNLDLFVQALETANEENTQWLRRFQMALILMIFVAAGFMISLHYAWIIRPLEALSAGVRAIGRGEFGTEINTDYIREFAQVNKGFNQMSTSLKILYTDLEGQVARQTEDLERQNRDLALLYQTTRDLHQILQPKTAVTEFLGRTLPAVSAVAGSVHLFDAEHKRSDLVASLGLPEDSQTEPYADLDGSFSDSIQNLPLHYLDSESKGRLIPLPEHARFEQMAVFPITYKEEELGLFTLYFSDGHTLSRSDHELLQTLSSQLGVSVANSRFAQERRLLAVLQERNLIAQGLHDSIAQTLTFLNLQVQMLESAYNAAQKEQVEENIRFIKDGVQECYDDVRELLLNFRTKISNKDFPEAVSTLLSRFEQQTQIEVNTTWVEEGSWLNHDEQLQIIFILQESLSNIRKHAQADKVEVSLINRQDFTLKISDDGIGFDTQAIDSLSGEHVGLGIMQERARRIDAVLNVESQPGKGTTVTLVLPQHKRTTS